MASTLEFRIFAKFFFRYVIPLSINKKVTHINISLDNLFILGFGFVCKKIKSTINPQMMLSTTTDLSVYKEIIAHARVCVCVLHTFVFVFISSIIIGNCVA